jgi:uncharacterized UPF0160 family protein
MTWILSAAAALILVSVPAGAAQRPILHDSVTLNIGVNCQWQSHCMSRQRSAMKSALAYVANRHPPQWRIQTCNRNANRGGNRVDWIGFNHCIRNTSLRASSWRTRKRP